VAAVMSWAANCEFASISFTHSATTICSRGCCSEGWRDAGWMGGAFETTVAAAAAATAEDDERNSVADVQWAASTDVTASTATTVNSHTTTAKATRRALPSGLVRTRYGTSPTKSAGQAKTAVSLVGRPWAALELGDCRPVRRELHAFVFQGLSTLWHCSMSVRGSRCRVWRQRGVSPRGAASLAGQVCPVATFADQMWGQKKQQQQQRQQAPG